jgi:hypothetical protein
MLIQFVCECVCGPRKMVPPARFQRATFRLGGGRSMQLSYGSTSEEIIEYPVNPVNPV